VKSNRCVVYLEWIGWGSFGLSWSHFYGILTYHMFNDASHLDWLSTSMDTILGANPLGTTFITGLGHRYPRDPVQWYSMHATNDLSPKEPIPGYAVMGPYGHVSFMSPAFALAQGDRSNYPYLTQLTSPFPVLRRWSDSNLLPQYNEGGVGPISWECGVFQVLSQYSKHNNPQ
jgi:hypothetical protein